MAIGAGRQVNLFTVMGIAAVAYVLTTLAHEGLGHGGACLAVGGKPLEWGAYYFDCDSRNLPDWASRLVAAAGSTVNLVLCLLFAAWLKADLAQPKPHGGLTVFLWLMFAINGYTWAGYYFFSGLAGIGDWGTGEGAVLYDVSFAGVARVVMAVGGIAIYVWLAKIAAGFLGRIVGGDRLDLARRISWTSYATGGTLAILIGLMNPVGFIIVLISSMASSLGGTSGLFWAVRMMKRDAPGVEFGLDFNWIWIVAGIVAASAYAIVLGPSLKL